MIQFNTQAKCLTNSRSNMVVSPNGFNNLQTMMYSNAPSYNTLDTIQKELRIDLHFLEQVRAGKNIHDLWNSPMIDISTTYPRTVQIDAPVWFNPYDKQSSYAPYDVNSTPKPSPKFTKAITVLNAKGDLISLNYNSNPNLIVWGNHYGFFYILRFESLMLPNNRLHYRWYAMKGLPFLDSFHYHTLHDVVSPIQLLEIIKNNDRFNRFNNYCV